MNLTYNLTKSWTSTGYEQPADKNCLYQLFNSFCIEKQNLFCQLKHWSSKEQSVSVLQDASCNGTLSCQAKPGEKVWITVKPKFQVLKGRLVHDCSVYIMRADHQENDITVQLPVQRSNGQLDAEISCQTSLFCNSRAFCLVGCCLLVKLVLILQNSKISKIS